MTRRPTPAFPDRQPLRQFQEVEQLDDAVKHLVKTFLDALLETRGAAEPPHATSPATPKGAGLLVRILKNYDE